MDQALSMAQPALSPFAPQTGNAFSLVTDALLSRRRTETSRKAKTPAASCVAAARDPGRSSSGVAPHATRGSVVTRRASDLLEAS